MRSQFLIVMGMLVLGHSAEASFFQTSCSSADGKVRVEDGQIDNSITLIAWRPVGDRMQQVPVKLERGEATLEVKSKQVLEEERHDGCKEGHGVSSFRRLSLEKVEISRQDGQPFSEDFSGVGKDGRIEATLLCEQAMNSRVFCGEN